MDNLEPSLAPDRPPLWVGCAAGFSGDRTDAAAPVVRALALAQLARREQPDAGYEPLLEDLLEPVLADCLAHGIRIVSNFGAANPEGAARCIQRLAQRLGLRVPRIAVVHGDDVSGPAYREALRAALGAEFPEDSLVSANAYIGARAIAEALQAGAEIVVAGRVSDPSLTLGPAMAHFGWAWDDWDRLARATMAGHLLECGAQVTGGYFADPGFKDVQGLARLGYPIAIIEPSGDCTITKPEGTGGLVSERTVKEQLLYEVHDPAAYLTPDVVADLSEAEVHQVGPDAVRLSGVRGHAHNGHYKVNVCHASGWLAEGEISYAGPRALERARLAGEVLRERLGGEAAGDLRLDWIGVASVLGDDAGRWRDAQPASAAAPQDVRLRAAWLRPTQAEARRLPREVNALYTCGPAGGGGVRTALRARLGTVSCLLAQQSIATGWKWAEEEADKGVDKGVEKEAGEHAA